MDELRCDSDLKPILNYGRNSVRLPTQRKPSMIFKDLHCQRTQGGEGDLEGKG